MFLKGIFNHPMISQMLQPITPLDDAFSTGSGGSYIETLLYDARYETLSASILANSELKFFKSMINSIDPEFSIGYSGFEVNVKPQNLIMIPLNLNQYYRKDKTQVFREVKAPMDIMKVDLKQVVTLF
ncbi:hypothetical protein PV327_008939 [Microctonus hyperodae]|uniref:Uncharacterized protein n=1 Tax=Microctonus hyperodae TaxID=165561 RepID=A0AA39KVD3_MICHY|nr:hypothetical protein PV327_008939 [Microctonus hyperodae]